jgi:hypothetical protein
MGHAVLLKARPGSQRLQEVDDRVDFFFGENVISPERRHHREGITLGFIGDDRDQIGAVRIFGFDVGECRPDVAGKIADLDLVPGQAVALAAIVRELLSFRGGRLRLRRTGDRHSAEQQRDCQRRRQDGLRRRDDLQRRFLRVLFCESILAASYRAVRSCAA